MTAPTVVHEPDAALDTWSDPVTGRGGFRTVLGAPSTTTADFTAGVTEREPEGWLGQHQHEPSEIFYAFGVGSFEQIEYRFSGAF